MITLMYLLPIVIRVIYERSLIGILVRSFTDSVRDEVIENLFEEVMKNHALIAL